MFNNNNKLNNNYYNTNNMLMSSNNYSFNKSLNKGSIHTLNAEKLRTKIIDHFFSPIIALSSKPTFIVSRDKVIVNVFYYIPKSEAELEEDKGYKKVRYGRKKIQSLNQNTLNNLGRTLRKLFDRKVELQFVKLNYPYLNRTILAKYIGINRNNYKFNKVVGSIFRNRPVVKNNFENFSNKYTRLDLPSHMLGMKIRASGRLNSERAKPRLTVIERKLGNFNDKNGTYTELGSWTIKSRHGAVTVKVWITHKMIP
ncbi:ribosomal protein S3 (mitochondrion) [Trichosporon asahii var. asahii CBS 2479]|jgi:hypothetical protein|nr:ribosomal protein S3 [Trichosporon asahii var. asahii CBS 2479]EJT45004.1 ribosomal protein S3 [Trichosporon asahii var. asahii CBS 2479]